jgi:hypothetical protein
MSAGSFKSANRSVYCIQLVSGSIWFLVGFGLVQLKKLDLFQIEQLQPVKSNWAGSMVQYFNSTTGLNG